MSKRLKTLQEISDQSGINIITIRRQIWKGKIPFIQLSERGKIWIDEKDFDHFLQSNKRTF